MAANKDASGYLSELDRFLQEYDKKHPGLSVSQQKEIAKSNRVDRLRDDVTASDPASPLWKDF